MTQLSAIGRAKKMNVAISKISDVISLYGYSEIFLPIYEYYDVLADKTFNFSDENIIRFIDRNTGKSLVLRPDFTPQVCRIVAYYLSNMPLPIRLSYSGRIFRNVGVHKGIKSEKYQVGCELFGGNEFDGDLELLLIVKRVMAGLNIEQFKIVVGDKRFISILASFVDIERLLEILGSKNYSELSQLLSSLNKGSDTYKLISFLPDAFGDLTILDKIEELSSFSDELKGRITYIRSLIKRYEDLGGDTAKLVFDIGETRGLNYYTGINIDIISDKNGLSLGGGGRYDKLMEKFGYDIPASGVAFNVDEILGVWDSYSSGIDDIVYLNNKETEKAEKLRDTAKKVFLQQ